MPLPDTVDDAQAILLSDIYPTSWFGARLAEVGDGDTVAIVGAGPVGQAAVACARLQGAGRIIVVDGVGDRLDMARSQHAETVDFHAEDPVEAVRELTGGIGVDRVIEAVGVDAQKPSHGPAADAAAQQAEEFGHERSEVAPEQNPDGATWVPGDAPTLAARWAVQMVAKAGTVGTIGVYPPQVQHCPFGEAFMKNLTLRMGNCNHRRYVPPLVSLVASKSLDPTPLVTRWGGTPNAVEAYRRFDRREAGWTKVVLGVSDDGAVAPGLGEAAGTGAATTAGSPGPTAAEATKEA
ncbi:zinc-binding dehydrogenase [Streptomyces sp. NPDC085944]|uniref:zinc-binding dehydrogenase n=1 Tax=Streptomyces sp. NPDC085944 TaxID=3154962 RepID=UPI003425E31B